MSRYRRSELQNIYWAECSECDETIVIAHTPDGIARLDTVVDGSVPGEQEYVEHDCPADREPA